jgi:hypothetical protein
VPVSGQRKAAQPFGQVSTPPHMDRNWGGVKDCNARVMNAAAPSLPDRTG